MRERNQKMADLEDQVRLTVKYVWLGCLAFASVVLPTTWVFYQMYISTPCRESVKVLEGGWASNNTRSIYSCGYQGFGSFEVHGDRVVVHCSCRSGELEEPPVTLEEEP